VKFTRNTDGQVLKSPKKTSCCIRKVTDKQNSLGMHWRSVRVLGIIIDFVAFNKEKI